MVFPAEALLLYFINKNKYFSIAEHIKLENIIKFILIIS